VIGGILIDWLRDQGVVDLLEGGYLRLGVGSSDKWVEVVYRLLYHRLRLDRGIREPRKSSI
jgi:hypothetical protein